MKKLMSLMIGMSLVLGTVAVSFADDTTAPKKEKKAGKKTGKKKTAEPKKEGSK
jgi:hypothetical protein